MQRQIVSADGANIWAEQIGNPTKPAVVFIHGFGLCSIAFEKQFADVSLQENLHMVRSVLGNLVIYHQDVTITLPNR